MLCLLKPSARLHISQDSLLHSQVLCRVQPERPRYSPNTRLSVFAWWRLHNYCGRLWLAQTYQWQQHQYFHEGKSRNFTSYLCWPCCLHLLNSLQIPVSSAVCKVAIERRFLNNLLIIIFRKDSVIDSPMFWLFFLLNLMAYSCFTIAVSISDALCFDILKERHHQYGAQRVWGSIGWGLFTVRKMSVLFSPWEFSNIFLKSAPGCSQY